MIPFCKTTLGKEEKEAIGKVIDSGWVVLGERTKEFEQKFAEYVGAAHAIFVDSGTAALFLGVKALIEFNEAWKNQYWIRVPSLTFCATAEVLVHAAKIPVFSDVRKDNFCMENVDITSLPVNLLGNQASDGALIYDSAHRIERGDMKFGPAINCYSFYATKNMTTGQGGMITTNVGQLADWMRRARDHGLSLGTKERYTEKYKQYDVGFVGWRVKGDDLRAAIGIEQLKKLPWMTERRNEIVAEYNKLLGYQRTGNHVYPVLVSDREAFMQHMFDKGVQCTVHFRPLHKMQAYRGFWKDEKYGARKDELPNTEYLGEHIVSLPLYPTLDEKEVQFIAEAALSSNQLIYES